ncbi:endonuclease I [Haloarcula laminariae]|uniref:endonuclease I n=1 Tax=Haloarcula laminariae TaxID=2961577 RepID=UPI002405BA30|nr:endonuclease I [Halomicroarcula sp. FL173]
MSERYEWLDERIGEIIDRYEAGQSLREIADIFDVSTSPIHKRLRDHDVGMRNGGREYISLGDCVDSVVEQYVEQDRSLQTIADHYETSVDMVQFHLENAGHGYDLLRPKTADVGFSPYQVSVIQGELLGDGCLYRRESDACFFQLSTTTRAHAVQLMKKLPDGLFPKSQPKSFTRDRHFTDGEYTTWRITSRPQPLFSRMYDEWYEIREEHNRKIVPSNYTLDRTALLHWYWGDGSCSIRDRGAPRVSFATHGFPESSVQQLHEEVEQLGYDNYTVEQNGVEDGSGLYIRLRDYDARSFLADFRRRNMLPQYDHKFPVPTERNNTT